MADILLGQRNGCPMLSMHGISLLYGVPEERLKASDPLRLPIEWKIATGRRRDEAIAALGAGHDVFAALEYWAARDLGRHIVVCGDEALLGLSNGVQEP